MTTPRNSPPDNSELLEADIQRVEKTMAELVAEVQKLGKLIESDIGSRWFKTVLVVLPVLLGAWIWLLQQEVKDASVQHSQILSAQLSRSGEFYTKRLTIYDEVHGQVTGLVAALEEAHFFPESKSRAIESIQHLGNSADASAIYLSTELRAHLKELFSLCTQLPVLTGAREGDLDRQDSLRRVDALVSRIRNRMRRDLQLDTDPIGLGAP